jgi:transcriptional regulator with XRE-family HTH domain
MNHSNQQLSLDKARIQIAKRVRELRKERHWTQAELSKRLQISQGRLSTIEGGGGSFTAEQFLAILKLFNVSATHFVAATADRTSELQNALARLGAQHLKESQDVLPSEQLEKVSDVVRETLVLADSPRLVTALAPVLVRNVDRINLKKLQAELVEVGLGRRLAWLVENTLEAIREELAHSPRASWARTYRRAEVVLATFLEFSSPLAAADGVVPDLLDRDIRSKQTREDVASRASAISFRWGIVTSLQTHDFAEALRGARAGG